MLGGAVSGNADTLAGVAFDLVDGIARRPYGRRPTDDRDWSAYGFPSFGDFMDLTRRYAETARQIVGRIVRG